MTEKLDWRKYPDKWPRDVNGYAICPNCGSMIHERYTKVHAAWCGGQAKTKEGEG